MLNVFIVLVFAQATFLPAVAAVATDATETKDQYRVDAKAQMKRLLAEADTDHDKRITILDRNVIFWLEGLDGTRRELSTPYRLSNLLQELKLASDEGRDSVSTSRIFENPVDRISRSIRDLYWDGLTRRVDPDSLEQALTDSKLAPSAWRYLYVPASDEAAFKIFGQAQKDHPELHFKVERLASGTEQLAGPQGLLALGLDEKGKGRPFVVPGGRFNEMYGWDSYFESLGLLLDNRRDLAHSMAENFIYEIENYGKILNANRSYYLNRSQPPFFTSLITALADHESNEWLDRALSAALKEYFNVWMNTERLTDTGLSRYYGSGHGIPPEVEKGHFDPILKPVAKRLHISVDRLTERYNSGVIKDAELDDFFAQDRAVRESGHDTTYRWRVAGKDRAADFVTVDLNSLLYKYELDIASLIKTRFKDQYRFQDHEMASGEWLERAARRQAKMLELMWDPDRKIFFDYNFKSRTRSDYISATAYYPFWAGGRDPHTQFLRNEEAIKSIDNLSRELEMPGGISSTARSSLAKVGQINHPRQWDYPNGWAPHQILVWGALENVGLKPDRLIYKWLYTLTRNAANFNGTVPEKTDVVSRSHAVFAEYGNVGVDFAYITKEGFGWMNASYQIGLSKLPIESREKLKTMRPPEWAF